MKNYNINYDDIKVHPVFNGWRTLEPIAYKDILVPDGFYSNGANIPKLLWSLIPPNDPMTLPGVIIHDYLCDKKQYKKADDYLEEILISSRVSRWKRKSILAGVRFYTKWVRNWL